MRILCSAKDSHIFLTKKNSVFVILMFEILTKRYLTTSLVLNNWAQVATLHMADIRYTISQLQTLTLLLSSLGATLSLESFALVSTELS